MKNRNGLKFCLALVAGLLSTSASAEMFEISDSYRVVPVEFTGTVTSSITDEIVVRLPDGTTQPYTGPVPDYAFDTGDAISIGFDAIVPTGQAIADGLVPTSADGIYRFQIGPRPEQLDNFPGTASYTNFRGNGGIEDVGSYSTDGGLFIVYDANTGSYSIDPSGTSPSTTGDTFGIGFFDFPALAYDVSTEELMATTFLTLFPSNRGGLAWSGTGVDSGRIPNPIFNFDGSTYLGGSPVGALSNNDIRFSGGWNLPVFGQNPSPVPAPGMMLIFCLAAAAVWRRKTSKLAKSQT